MSTGKLKKILIIFNPKSGHRYPKGYQNSFIKTLKKYLPDTNYHWLITRKDLKYQLTDLNFANFSKIIIVGGDGTVKEVADYILNNQIDLPLAIVPQGSTNVLAASLKIPKNNEKAIKIACLGKQKKIDIGVLNKKHYFLTCISIGYWSRVVKDTKRGLKIRLGFWAYILTFFKQRKVTKIDFDFNLDNEKHQITGNTLIIANAISLFKLKPATKIDYYDGQLDIFITKNKTFLGFFIVAFLFFTNQRWLPSVFKSSGKKIIINNFKSKKNAIQIDGETIKVDKIEIEIIPKKLKIIS